MFNKLKRLGTHLSVCTGPEESSLEVSQLPTSTDPFGGIFENIHLDKNPLNTRHGASGIPSSLPLSFLVTNLELSYALFVFSYTSNITGPFPIDDFHSAADDTRMAKNVKFILPAQDTVLTQVHNLSSSAEDMHIEIQNINARDVEISAKITSIKVDIEAAYSSVYDINANIASLSKIKAEVSVLKERLAASSDAVNDLK